MAAPVHADTPDLLALRQAGDLSGACALLAGSLDMRLRVAPVEADNGPDQPGCGPAGEAPWLLRVDEDQGAAIQLTEEGLAGISAQDTAAPALFQLLQLEGAQGLVVTDDFSGLVPLAPPRQRSDCVPGTQAPGQWLLLLRMARLPGAGDLAPHPLDDQYICPMRGDQGVLLVDGQGRVGRIGISPVGMQRLTAARLSAPTDFLRAVQTLVPSELGAALRDGIQLQIAYRGGQSLSLAVGNDAVRYYLR